ncbi:hypothetical protein M378DRAFT_10566 [Amanita muscaria Koide BX008]|uniref:NACHT domain-containing protein n=1 Tax=Amanita muscaria (strain Koide BX008) TaxID=946122 RepID=A0A0C2XA67_AMAMK|nr:hypothetical protein M378DRAFT_10566 [Amanita muscaria Koide BX008]
MSKFFKRKEKQTDTDPKTNIEQPTIQVNEERLEHGETSGRKEKSKGKKFFSVGACQALACVQSLTPGQNIFSHSRSGSGRYSSGGHSEGGYSTEHQALPDPAAYTTTRDGKPSDLGGIAKPDDQTVHGSTSNIAEVEGQEQSKKSINPPTEEPPVQESVVVQDAIDRAEQRVQTMHTIGSAAQKVAEIGAQGDAGLAKVDTVSDLLQPLKIFDSVVKALGDLHPYVKIALSILSWASQARLCLTPTINTDADLLSRIADVYKFLVKDGQLKEIVSMKDILAQTSEVILECAKFIQSYSQPNFFERLGKGMFSSIEGVIAKYNKTVDGLMQQFQQYALRDVLTTTHDVLATTRGVREAVKDTLEELKRLGDNQSLNGIAYAEREGLNDTKACLDGTREEILGEVIDWFNNPDTNTPRILWLSGRAGTGKSAIAHTIARALKDAGALGSCFRFEKGDVNRYMKLFTTISRDLAGRDLRLKQALANVIARDPSIGTTDDVTQQWKSLIMGPLSATDIVGRLVIVIDALDESGDDESRRHILKIFAEQTALLPHSIRVLITSRPLQDIRDAFEGVAHVQAKSLDDIPLSSTERDIESYISDQLKDTHNSFTPVEIAQLAKRSDGLFEWARLACGYAQSRKAGFSKKERIAKLLSHSGRGTTLLDHIYTDILTDVIEEDEEVLTRFRSVMRHVLFTLEPLPLGALLNMHRSIQVEDDEYDAGPTVLHPMASILACLHDASMPIRLLHSSFRDFLTDRNRSGRFFIDAADAHLDLALASLYAMRQKLQFNICRLESSYVRNSEIGDLLQRVRLYISPELSYSCRFLANHVGGIAFNLQVAHALLVILGSEQTLFWIETLSALQSLNVLHGSLTIIAKWLEDKEGFELCTAIAKDGLHFVQNFGNGKWAVSGSNDGSIRVWDVEIGVLVGNPLTGHIGGVYSVAFSPDGKQIVSGSEDGIFIWGAMTGLLVREIRGHDGAVRSVAFSPDGERIVSGSKDCTICIWDTKTGQMVDMPLEGHFGTVCSVAFSPNGQKIASGSSDMTICIWDVKTGLQVCFPLQGHSAEVYSAAFSPDSKKIVSGSADKTICVWDAETGFQIGSLLTGHTSAIYSVSFFLNGNWVLSGSGDFTMGLWDIESGTPVCSPFKCHDRGVRTVAISSDGNKIMSGSWDKNVYIRDFEVLQVGTFSKGHTNKIYSVALSPDGNQVVSGSGDCNICIWDVMTGALVRGPIKGHSGAVRSVAFSSDGKKIASGPEDMTICIWDANTGLQLVNPLKGHTKRILSIAFSPDDQKIVSG